MWNKTSEQVLYQYDTWRNEFQMQWFNTIKVVEHKHEYYSSIDPRYIYGPPLLEIRTPIWGTARTIMSGIKRLKKVQGMIVWLWIMKPCKGFSKFAFTMQVPLHWELYLVSFHPSTRHVLLHRGARGARGVVARVARAQGFGLAAEIFQQRSRLLHESSSRCQEDGFKMRIKTWIMIQQLR